MSCHVQDGDRVRYTGCDTQGNVMGGDTGTAEVWETDCFFQSWDTTTVYLLPDDEDKQRVEVEANDLEVL